MPDRENRREFLQELGLGLLSLCGAASLGIGAAFAALHRRSTTTAEGLKPVSLSGFMKLPSTKRSRSKSDICVDVCVEAGDVDIGCISGCDGCDGCNSACDLCNGCNACDHGCDAGCHTCNRCNGCDGCDMCDAVCNTCNQCDMGQDLCVISCDGVCDGCNTNNSCNVDIDKNGVEDTQQIKALQLNIQAQEKSLEAKKKVLARLRKR